MPVRTTLSDVDAGRRAAEAQDRDLVSPGSRPGVISYIARVVAQRVGHVAADEPDDRRRRGHREAADAVGLGDRRVADVGVGVVRAVVAEEQAHRGVAPGR